jgi:hypothetical protein
MAKYEITKSVDVDEVNKRSGLPTGKKRTLAFGAIIDNLVEDRDLYRFTYLGEPFRAKAKELMEAAHPLGGASESMPASTGSAPTASASTPVAKPEHKLKWEAMSSSIPGSRAKVPGGWLVSITNGGLTFLPDAEHSWDGSSL